MSLTITKLTLSGSQVSQFEKQLIGQVQGIPPRCEWQSSMIMMTASTSIEGKKGEDSQKRDTGRQFIKCPSYVIHGYIL